MSQYLLSVHSVQGEAPPPMTPDEMQAVMECVQALESEMKASGTFVFGGRLHDAEAATVVRRGAPGLVMTDGPFVESKEHIGGFYVIEAANYDEAVKLAMTNPGAEHGTVEVRQVFGT